ncbi:MAG: hypothetical protein C5B54_05305 [Acidobacteria bacterium]|nr:MAG: hypothetical protein C5B54_05305 [Acidobacteriota bacterium]
MSNEIHQPRLKVCESPGVFRTVLLEKSPLTIGRHGSCDLRLTDPCVSRHHAEISKEEDQFKLVDLQSKSGTLVNGSKVSSCILHHADRIYFGKSELPQITFLVGPDEPQRSTQEIDTSSLFVSMAGGDLMNVARLLESARVFGTGLPLDDILDLVLDIAIEVTRAERAFLVLRDNSGNLQFKRGRDKTKESLKSEQFKISNTILRQVVTTGQKAVLLDSGSNLPETDSILELDLRTIVCLPLRRLEIGEPSVPSREEDSVIGALYLDSRSHIEPFSKIGEGILDSLAGDVTAVIENARLLRAAREKEKMENELSTAYEIQNILLPTIDKRLEFFEAFGCTNPSRYISGDFYDLFPLPNGNFAIAIADVTGKGVPAAILSSMIQGMLYAEANQQKSAADMMKKINTYLFRRLHTERFATLFFAELNPNGELSFVNAGHNPPFRVTQNGHCEELATSGLLLGAMDTFQYEEKTITLVSGDVVCLFTDGITEAKAPDGDFFGEERLGQLLLNNRQKPLKEIGDEILRAVDEHSGGGPRMDDITILLLRFGTQTSLYAS